MPFNNSTIDLRSQDDLIRQKGEAVKYFVGSRCPCGSESGHSDYSCPNCEGTGHFYPDPPQDMYAIIADVDLRRDPFGIPGFVLPGDLFISVRPARCKLPTVSDWDAFMLTWGEGITQEGEDVIADPSGIDALQNPIVQVQSAYGINPDATSAVNFIVTYKYGVDFSLVAPTTSQLYPQSIQWLTTNRPQPGSKYVVKYTAQPLWIAFAPPKVHFERGSSLGQTLLLRKRTVVLANSLGNPGG